MTLRVKALCECDCALCFAQAVLEWNRVRPAAFFGPVAESEPTRSWGAIIEL